jgi:Chaperone of endosialidase
MTKPVTIPNTFATATTAIPLSNLDADFSTVATAMNDANTYSNYAADTGSANAYVVTLTGISAIYSAGLRIQFKAGNANTTASTLNVNAQGAKNITYQDASAIASGTIAANSIVDVMYDGTQFLLMNDPAGGTGGDVVGPASATDNAIVRFDGTTGKLVQNSVVTIADSTGDISGVGQLNATTLDATNIEVTNIKAKDGTAAASIADSTGVVSVTANPVLSGGTANGVLYLNGSKVATSGSALTFDGTNLELSGVANPRIGIKSSAANSAFLSIAGNANAFGTASFDLVQGSDSVSYVWNRANADVSFGVNNAEQMRLTSTGLGIGTSSTTNIQGDASKLITSSGSASNTLSVVAGGYVNPQYAQIFLSGGYGDNGFVSGFYLRSQATTPFGAASDNTFQIYTTVRAASPTLLATLNSSGNLGLGVTPSTVNALTGYKSFEIGQLGNSIYAGNNQTLIGTNVKWDGSTAKYAQAASTYAASLYNQTGGSHSWSTAPSGTAGSAITFTQSMTLDASGNLGIGSTSPTQVLTIAKSDNFPFIHWNNSSNTNIAFAGWHGGTAGGDDLRLGTVSTKPITFYTNNTERARITSGGDLLVGTTGNTRAGVVAYFASNDIFNSHSGAAAGAVTSLYTGWYGATSTTTGTLSFNVTTNGDVTNTNNSYGAISDAKLKENIVDASPKLADLMQVRVRNYNFKEGQTHKQIGVVAQELEQIFPSMVNESPDRDADGNDLGTTTKQVKYSVFVPMLIKAIQEQQALIESLTSRVAQLEGTQP